MQIALLAASAAYLRSDLRPSKGGGGAGLGKSHEKSITLLGQGDGGDREEMWGLPDGEVKRFVLAEQVSSVDGVKGRAMGKAVVSTRGPHKGGPSLEAKGMDRRPVAIPLEGSVPADGVGLSSVAVEDQPAFDPIPNGAGYSITADAASHFDMASKTVTFSGNVALHSQSFILNANRLVVHLDSEDGQLKRMVANGSVDVTLTNGAVEDRFQGWGEEAVFEPASKTIVMRGWPRILGHGREHRAASATTKMTIHTEPSKLVTEGRAQTRILANPDGALLGVESVSGKR